MKEIPHTSRIPSRGLRDDLDNKTSITLKTKV